MSKNGDSDRPIVQIWDENSGTYFLDTVAHRIVSCTYFRGEPTVMLAEIMGWVGWIVSRENRTIIVLTYG